MARPEQAIVRILRNGRPVGLGFHVGHGTLLTCAHVVNTALGRAARDHSTPDDVPLTVQVALGASSPREATVRHWHPKSGGFDQQDVAVLEFVGPPPPDLHTLRLEPGDAAAGEVQAFGPADERDTPGHVRGLVLGAVDSGRLQVNQRVEGIFRIRSGFSGGPVWRPDTGDVVGALQAVGVDDDATDAYVISVGVLGKALEPAPATKPRPTTRTTAKPTEICVLHLADTQFGDCHGFGRDGLTEADRRHSRLAGRLLEDLAWLRERHGLTPDLVTVAGDIAERAMPKEYLDAYEFLDDLTRNLDLPRDRVVLVPGNHDVNRKKCHAYFLSREGDDEEPIPPYWAKWEPYASLIEKFHNRPLPRDEPWSIHEFPELNLVVAGLNSTMAESHRGTDHYGWLGEEQLRWFAERLRRARTEGWLRLGVLHHNPVRGASDDDANLRDADSFADLLDPYLHAVLHGHTHGSRITYLGSGLPVLGGGSAGVVPAERAPDVPNQYQILRFSNDGLRLWARRLDGQRPRWIGDTSISEDGDDWRRHIPVRWHAVGAVFPRSEADSDQERFDRSRTDQAEPSVRDRSDDLLSRVAEVYRLREPTATVEEVGTGSGERYLRVSRRRSIGEDHPVAIDTFPIGVVRGELAREHILDFHDRIDARFRMGGAAIGSILVYDGDPAPAELRELAGGKGVELLSLAEYQLGYDLRPYTEWQAGELDADPIYPSDLYIPQRYSMLGSQEVQQDLLEDLRGWLTDRDGHFVLVLGEFGHGKTFLLRELARRMHVASAPAVPVLVHLKDLEKTHQLNQLVAAQLTQGGERRIDIPLFRYLLREGRIALLFDGYDELASRTTYERAAEHLNTIIQAAEGRAKVVLTSRDSYFLTDDQATSALGDKLMAVSGRRIVRLQGFSEGQIRTFLTRRLGDEVAAARRLSLLKDVRDLLGLSRNPRMLSFIGQIEERRLLAAKRWEGEITAAALYRELLDQWIEYEWRRLGRPKTPSQADLWRAVADLAGRLWQASRERLTVVDLHETSGTLAAITRSENALTVPETSHLLGSATLLVRDPDGHFEFVHRSVLEWLVASEIAKHLNGDTGGSKLLNRPMSPLMVDFVVDLAGPATAERWARGVLFATPDATAASENAEQILKHLGRGARGARLSEQDLRGRDLTGADLRGADLRNTDLTEATLVRTNFNGANLGGATLVRARLDDATLVRATLHNADLTGARLINADLRGASLTGSRLRRAALLGAKLTEPQLVGADLAGAARDGDSVSRQFIPMRASISAVEFSPDGGIVATGSVSGKITLWDVAAGKALRELTGHTDWVNAVAWSPDGTQLATSSHDGTVRLWNPTTGAETRRFTGHAGPVTAVAWSPDGTQLATGSHDRTVRLWNPTTNSRVRELTGHAGPVTAAAWSPDGTQLATGSHDRTVRLWNPTTNSRVRELTGHTGWVNAVAWSPDGTQLATTSSDGTVRLWNPTTNSPVCELTGHTDWVNAVTWSPDGKLLATTSSDDTVRLWNPTTGAETRRLTGHAGPVTGPVTAVAWSPDGKLLATTSSDGTVRLWNPTTGAETHRLTGHTDWVNAVAWSPDGTQLATTSSDDTVHLWNPTTGAETHRLTGHTDWVNAGAWSPDGTQLATSSHDGTVRLWNPTTAETRRLTGHTDWVNAVAWSPDGTQLATSSHDGTVRLWNPTTGAETRRLTGHADWVNAVAWSPDGKLLATGSHDRTVRLWNPTTNSRVRELTGHAGPVTAAAWSPDGKLLATGSHDRTVRLWNPTTNSPVCELTGHTGWVNAVAWSPDGKLLATTSSDGTVRLWNPTTGAQTHRLTGHTSPVYDLAWSPDGTHLAAGTSHSITAIWVIRSPHNRPAVELLPLADGGWAAFGDGWHKISGTVNGEFWYVSGLCRFEPGVLTSEQIGSRPLPLDALLPVPDDRQPR